MYAAKRLSSFMNLSTARFASRSEEIFNGCSLNPYISCYTQLHFLLVFKLRFNFFLYKTTSQIQSYVILLLMLCHHWRTVFNLIILVLVPPKVVSPDTVVRAVLNATRTLCTANGTLPIYMTVIRNSTTLVNATNTASILVKEEGNYTCRATSKYGTDERKFIVVESKSRRLFLLKCL